MYTYRRRRVDSRVRRRKSITRGFIDGRLRVANASRQRTGFFFFFLSARHFLIPRDDGIRPYSGRRPPRVFVYRRRRLSHEEFAETFDNCLTIAKSCAARWFYRTTSPRRGPYSHSRRVHKSQRSRRSTGPDVCCFLILFFVFFLFCLSQLIFGRRLTVCH